MHISKTLLALPALASALTIRQQRTCYSGVYAIIPPHHGQALDGGFSLMSTTLQKLQAAIPDTAGYQVQYDSSTEDYPTAIAQGMAATIAEIESYLAACPTGMFAIMGISEGAIVTMNTVCGNRDGSSQLSASYEPNLVGVIGYGEESFVPNQPYDYGTCTGQGPAQSPRPNPDGCLRFLNEIKSYCDVGDPNCCSGTDAAAHTAYPSIYDDEVVQFILSNYNAKKAA